MTRFVPHSCLKRYREVGKKCARKKIIGQKRYYILYIVVTIVL